MLGCIVNMMNIDSGPPSGPRPSTVDPRPRRPNAQIALPDENSTAHPRSLNSPVFPNATQHVQNATPSLTLGAANCSTTQSPLQGTTNADPIKDLQNLMDENFRKNKLAEECKKAQDQKARADKYLSQAQKTHNPYPATIAMLQENVKVAEKAYRKAQSDYQDSQSACRNLSSFLSLPNVTSAPAAVATEPSCFVENERFARLEHEFQKHSDTTKQALQLGQDFKRKASAMEQDIKQLQDFQLSFPKNITLSTEKIYATKAEVDDLTRSNSARLDEMKEMTEKTKAHIESLIEERISIPSGMPPGEIECLNASHQDLKSQFQQFERQFRSEFAVAQEQLEGFRHIQEQFIKATSQISAVVTAIRSLETRWANIQTDHVVQSMVHAMNEMYPNIPQVVSDQLGQMHQQLEQFDAKLRASDTQKVFELSEKFEKRVFSLENSHDSYEDARSRSNSQLQKINQELTKIRKDMHELQNHFSSRQTAFETFGELYQEDIAQLARANESMKAQLNDFINDLEVKFEHVKSLSDRVDSLSLQSHGSQIDHQAMLRQTNRVAQNLKLVDQIMSQYMEEFAPASVRGPMGENLPQGSFPSGASGRKRPALGDSDGESGPNDPSVFSPATSNGASGTKKKKKQGEREGNNEIQAP